VAILAELEDLARQRDVVVNRARAVRRSYDGMKMKLEVLEREAAGGGPAAEESAKARVRLEELKEEFARLKDERGGIAQRIEAGDARIDALDTEIDKHKKLRREEASEAFQVIGEANKEISALRAELGLLETQMRQLYAEIGRHVSRHAFHDAACAAAAKEKSGLVEVMRALRRSIAFNHRLGNRD
jgi:chromosome segregation ATPase